MLALLLRRLQPARELQRIVVATSTESVDDRIEDVAREIGSDVYRGALDDVLSRFEGAASRHPGPLVRVTADCPLIDPAIVDDAIRLFERTPGCAYASNVEPRTYPDGLDVEVFSAAALQRVARMTKQPADREHVTTVIRRNPHGSRQQLSPATSIWRTFAGASTARRISSLYAPSSLGSARVATPRDSARSSLP